MIKTLIVDDSPLVRAILKDFLESDSAFQVIGEAENGLDAVTQAERLCPDLITMDIEMPVMNGLEAIGRIKKSIMAAIIVVTTHDTAKMAYEATVKGAHEFYAKDIFTSRMSEQHRTEILDTLKHISGMIKNIRIKKGTPQQSSVVQRRINAVVMAASTGGPKALCRLCADIPSDFPVPIILVQHNSSGFDRGFVQWLDGYTPLKVCLAEERVLPLAGNLYVAPTGRHLMIAKSGFYFDDGEPILNQKPAADILFKNAAELYKQSLVSVVLTGMGCDGAEGTRYVKQAGGITIAQDETSSMIYGMPAAAAATGCLDMQLPLDAIARRLALLSRGTGYDPY